MDEGLFDNVPLMNKERDKAWEQLIKRKDVSNMFTDTKFGFPLNGGYYDLWCIAWAKAWDAGFHEGWDKEDARRAERERIANQIDRMPFGDTAASFSIWIREGAK